MSPISSYIQNYKNFPKRWSIQRNLIGLWLKLVSEYFSLLSEIRQDAGETCPACLAGPHIYWANCCHSARDGASLTECSLWFPH